MAFGARPAVGDNDVRVSAFIDAFRSKRVALCIALGFASGLPLYMRGSTLTTWMRNEGINLRSITLFTLVGLIYTFKFLWAPFVDRYAPPWLGRRRGWMLIMQIALILGIGALGLVGAGGDPVVVVAIAATVTFVSATHDIALDAYRVDLLRPKERAAGSAMNTLGYRGAGIVAGGGALILSDFMPWPLVYWIMAGLMLVGVFASIAGPEPEVVPSPRTLGQAVVEPMKDFFGRPGALVALAFILLYKIGDYVSTDLTNLFLVDLKFSNTEIGTIQKWFAMAATIVGVILGGGLVPKLGVRRSLLLFGILQALTNSGYIALAIVGKSHLLLISAIVIDWGCGGMGAAAFAAYQISLCSKRFSAFQFALIASASTVLGRLFVGISGDIINRIGWLQFFVLTIALAVPGLLLIVFAPIERAAAPAEPAPAPPPAAPATPAPPAADK
jgi:PAT family beta-lactamase induction signal transducer AmpG